MRIHLLEQTTPPRCPPRDTTKDPCMDTSLSKFVTRSHSDHLPLGPAISENGSWLACVCSTMSDNYPRRTTFMSLNAMAKEPRDLTTYQDQLTIPDSAIQQTSASSTSQFYALCSKGPISCLDVACRNTILVMSPYCDSILCYSSWVQKNGGSAIEIRGSNGVIHQWQNEQRKSIRSNGRAGCYKDRGCSQCRCNAALTREARP
jgi:hypothetical protein